MVLNIVRDAVVEDVCRGVDQSGGRDACLHKSRTLLHELQRCRRPSRPGLRLYGHAAPDGFASRSPVDSPPASRPSSRSRRWTKRPARPRLDRADRPAERVGDLGLGESAVVGEHDHPTFERIQEASATSIAARVSLREARSRERARRSRPRAARRRRRATRSMETDLGSTGERREARGTVVAPARPQSIDRPVVERSP